MLLESRPLSRTIPTVSTNPAPKARLFAHRTTLDLEGLIEPLALTSLPVLLCGEAGTGKTSFADALFKRSRRVHAPVVRLMARALPSEEELFGVERREAGGLRSVDGIFTRADGGTVILEDADELPVDLDRRFVRLFQDGELSPVASSITRRVDLRIIATSSSTSEPSLRGRQSELVQRAFTTSLTLPPLRQRLDDVEALAKHFARIALERTLPEPIVVLSREAIAKLRSHAWPGNAHELRRVIDDAVLASRGAPIEPSHLTFTVTRPSSTLGNGERERLVAALAEGAWNQSRAAEILGVSRRTVIRKMERFGIPRPRKG